MSAQSTSVQIIPFGDGSSQVHEVLRFRYQRFVSDLGWCLSSSGGEERDAYDDHRARYCLLRRAERLVGCFRVVPCSGPYLGLEVFPQLASKVPYPRRPGHLEISRFAVASNARDLAPTLYAVMLDLGWRWQARALVAITDLSHERLLRRMGVQTRRYGPPQIVGRDRDGRPLTAVAGEIPLAEQSARLDRSVTALLTDVEITDETLVLGSRRLSA